MSFRPFRALAALGLVACVPAAQAEVFINEIHYDNAGTDSGERIEVVATAGESLSGWRIHLYNGTGSTTAATAYDNDPLPTGALATCGGATVRFATLSYAANGMQNGTHDGIALVNPSGTVVQFISYEGQIRASSGVASGRTSVNLPVSESEATAVGHSLQLGGTASGSAGFTWQAAQASTFGACNRNQSFGSANTPPSITTTTPASGAAGISPTATLSVAFSESVTLSTGAFALSCASSGSHPLSHATSGSSFTITPSGAFADGESCTLTVTASAVRDSGNASPTANTTVAYTLVNAAPRVTATTPANGATNVAPTAALSVDFSEPVTAGTTAFALNCASSGNHPLSYPTTGSRFTLTPSGAFTGGEACTLSISAAGLRDANNATPTGNATVGYTLASAAPTGYYSRVNTSSASQLRCSLHETIKGHTAYPYSASTTDSWDILEIADEDPANTARILDVYKNRSFAKVSERAGTGTGITYNREHTWPNSLGFSSQTGNLGLPYAPYTDTHILYLSDTAYNADRGNKPYANCPMSSGCSERATEVNNGTGGGTGMYPGNSNWVKGPDGNAGSFEVFNARKGDIARAILYMAIRYEGGAHPVNGQGEPDLELTDDRSKIVITSASPAYMGLLSTLLQWHQQDPPNAAERIRNEAIQQFQGNRNPFIDHPEWATAALFNSAKPATCQLN
ncbi:endonuclease [Silanimonas sp.]|uniref:endonuclease n=1 Tax=Silanimonas sp. TaxID=1929290 RepID=UPI0022BE509F|nr:endonuclease [Silanimonas sp.]MCZ8167241.1 endonuclease [Silanimonas sp.]